MRPPSFEETARTQARIESLQAANGRLLIQLDQAKHKTKDLVEAVYQAARDAAEQIRYQPVPRPRIRASKDEPETAICVVSDWQLGKRTPTYSTDICAKRIKQYAERVRRLTDIQRADRPINRCVVFVLGDICEGELIFPGQEHRIDASLFRQVMLDGPEILGTLVRELLAYFPEVVVWDVIGNHGALGGPGRKHYHPESNADAMLYEATRKTLKGESRLIWHPNMPIGERAWHKVITIGRHNYFLFHGDQMRGGGFAGIPMYGFVRAINNWAAGVIEKPFRYAFCGHWHSLWSMPINDRILWINGSTESANEWFREELKVQSKPAQWLMFAHDRRGITSEHRIWLD